MPSSNHRIMEISIKNLQTSYIAITVTKRKSILYIVLALIAHAPVLAEGQICEIKYGKKNLEKTNTGFPFVLLKTRCWQIGVEFNDVGDAITDKPIYACCKPTR